MNSEHIKNFDALCEQIMRDSEAAGLAVAVVNTRGETVFERFFGVRDTEKQLPIDENTVFGLASVSKSFTALAAQQLIEQGILDPRVPVRNYVPELRYPDITLRHLLSHSAGFFPMRRVTMYEMAQELGIDKSTDFALDLPYILKAREQLIADLNAQRRFTGRPGQHVSYSNHSFSLAGEIIRVFGGHRTFAEYLHERVFKPLGMTRSGAEMRFSGENIAVLYQKRDGKMTGITDMCEGFSSLLGGGGLRSTLADMKKYICMYLNRGKALNGERLLSAHGVHEMTAPRTECGLNDYYCSGLMRTAMDDITLIRHGGSMVGISSNMSFSFECGLGVMVLCNTSGVSAAKVGDAAMRLARGLNPVVPEREWPRAQWSEEFTSAVCGKYISAESGEVEITASGGELTVKMKDTRQSGYPVNDYMFRAGRGMLIKVYRDEEGQPYAIGSGLRMLAKS